MKSDVIMIDNQGKGFDDAVEETRKAAEAAGLNHKNSLQLQLLTEEMLSLARSVTGEMKATFWIESEGVKFDMHMATKTVLDKEERYQLISSATSRRNEITRSFLGRLRDAFEQAMAADVDHQEYGLPEDLLADLPPESVEEAQWDGYERSVLRKMADEVKIGIRSRLVDMVVSKTFAE